jgi:transcription elongation factor Elf1
MANKVLNITNICTNLQQPQLGIENLEMFISIYKNWLDDAHESMKQFIEMKNDMMEENEESIDKVGLLELECFK